MNLQHLGVYGVLAKNKTILLVLKARGPYTGLWDLPGGKPEHGESPIQTLSREILEETGIRVITSSLFDNLSICFNYVHEGSTISLHHLGLVYLIDEWDETSMNCAIQKEDVQKADWHQLEDLGATELSPFAWKIVTTLKANPLLY